MSYSNGNGMANVENIATAIGATGTRKTDVYNFIVAFVGAHGNPPSLDEICHFVDTLYPRDSKTSKSVAFYYLQELEKDGLISLPRRCGRRITAGRIIINEGAAGQDPDRVKTEPHDNMVG